MTDKENDDQGKPETDADGGGNDPKKAEKLFTQEQLDAHIDYRLERAKTKTTSDLMAQLGIEDVDEAKKTIEDAAKLKQDQMSELEKTQAQIKDAMDRAAQAKADLEAMQLKTNEALLKAAIISKAQGFNDPMDVWLFVDRSKIEVDENGSYSGIDEALKKLSEDKPYLIKVETNGNARPGTPIRATPKTVAERLLTTNQDNKPKSADELRQEINMTF